ncbi:PEGA domain-containing protein [candidate division WOR-3 bacterium]|nr:PEGA domain-containing protein [candidate division WOR-3 bacterium]
MKKTLFLLGMVSISLVVCTSPDSGRIEITSNPTGAYVYLDGRNTDEVTDCVLKDVSYGDHTLTLIHSGYPLWKRSITLSDDQPELVIDADFTRMPEQVTGLTAEGTEDGAGFILSWDAETNAETYNVYFRDYYYYEESLLADSIIGTSYIHENPERVGVYRVSAVVGGIEGLKSEELSTMPSYVSYVSAYELNGSGFSGISWDVQSGYPTNYSMADETYQDLIDCYFTNLTAGYEDTPYYLAGADVTAEDPGNTWLNPAGWRSTRISNALSDDIEYVILAPAGPYYDYVEISEYETYAILTEDGYYALIEVQYINSWNGELDILTTFQSIKGSRLFSGNYY